MYNRLRAGSTYIRTTSANSTVSFSSLFCATQHAATPVTVPVPFHHDAHDVGAASAVRRRVSVGYSDPADRVNSSGFLVGSGTGDEGSGLGRLLHVSRTASEPNLVTSVSSATGYTAQPMLTYMGCVCMGVGVGGWVFARMCVCVCVCASEEEGRGQWMPVPIPVRGQTTRRTNTDTTTTYSL